MWQYFETVPLNTIFLHSVQLYRCTFAISALQIFISLLGFYWKTRVRHLTIYQLEWEACAVEVSPSQPLNGRWKEETFTATSKVPELLVCFVGSFSSPEMEETFLHSIRVPSKLKSLNYLISCEVCVSFPSSDSWSRRRLCGHFAAFTILRFRI